jgi:rubrerythrin
MEILKLAQTMELEGKAYYERLAAETDVEALKGVFTFLAGQEQNHYDLFKAIEEGVESASIDDDIALGSKVKEFFGALDASFSLPEVVYDYQAAYGKALQMEKESVKMYSDLAEGIADGGKKAVEFIIAQEESHVRLLESLLEFVSNPATWLENAEWRHPDAY